MFNAKHVLINGLLALSTAVAAHAGGEPAARDARIREFLKGFDADTPAAMQGLPPRLDDEGKPVIVHQTSFTRDQIENGEFVREKRKAREGWLGPDPMTRSRPGMSILAPIASNDRPEDLVDDFKYDRLEAMESDQLKSASLTPHPWSGDYWPVYAGMIAKRYARTDAVPSSDWGKNHDEFLALEASTSVDQLSPAEKYDLLVGDEERTLTERMWAEGQQYYETYGKVETWMGLCHGWAPASYMMARPAHEVEVLAADGRTKIRFRPTDIKALATLLWAKAPVRPRLISGRCTKKNPAVDENGRLIDQDCFDTNPATWHLAVVNQLGHSKRAFVMDATYDYEVWNQPVYAYQYSYFNPKTRAPASTIEEARVPLSSFDNDKFHKYRSTDAVSVVGVAMDVSYGSEVTPSMNTLDIPSNDRQFTVAYVYDLELDAGGKIIGGEWYQRRHPDFLWTPPAGSRAQALGDRMLARAGDRESWNGSAVVPESWREAIAESSNASQPLARVVETLVTLSSVGI